VDRRRYSPRVVMATGVVGGSRLEAEHGFDQPNQAARIKQLYAELAIDTAFVERPDAIALGDLDMQIARHTYSPSKLIAAPPPAALPAKAGATDGTLTVGS
jgi:hypothetical protein